MSEELFDFMKIWTQSDAESERKIKKFLLKGMDRVAQARSDLLARINVGDPISSPVVKWMESWAYPTHVTGRVVGGTLSLDGYLFGKPVDAESTMNVLREGTILERLTDGVQVRVSSVDGVTASVDSYGNTTLSDDSEPVMWEILCEAWSDYRDASRGRSLDRFFRHVGTQIHAETFEIPITRKNTKYELVNDEVLHQITALLRKLRHQLAYSVLRSRPFHDGSEFVYGDKTQEPTMCGICTWPAMTYAECPNPNVYANKNGGHLTEEDLNALIRSLWLDEHADYNRGDWWIACHPYTHKQICDFDVSYRRIEANDISAGFHVSEFHSKAGKSFPILPENYMRRDALIVVNLAELCYGYFKNDRVRRKEIQTQGRYQRWLITFQTYGVVARNPRSNIGMIYGLAAP